MRCCWAAKICPYPFFHFGRAGSRCRTPWWGRAWPRCRGRTWLTCWGKMTEVSWYVSCISVRSRFFMFPTLSLSRNARFLNLTSRKVLAAILWQVSIPQNLRWICSASCAERELPWCSMAAAALWRGDTRGITFDTDIFLMKPLSPLQKVSRPQQVGGSWRTLHHLSTESSSQVDKGPLIGSVYALQPSVVFGSASASL